MICHILSSYVQNLNLAGAMDHLGDARFINAVASRIFVFGIAKKKKSWAWTRRFCQ